MFSIKGRVVFTGSGFVVVWYHEHETRERIFHNPLSPEREKTIFSNRHRNNSYTQRYLKESMNKFKDRRTIRRSGEC